MDEQETQQSYALPEVAEGLLAVEARSLLHGCVCFSREQGSWVRPWRLSPEQVRSVGSCLAWHPGLLRQMARTTAGVTIEFETDASEVTLEILVDSEPNGTKAVLERIDGEDDRKPHDGVSADVDGRHLPCQMPEEGMAQVSFTLDDVTAPDAHGMLHLPGFGVAHHVRIWLPALRGCIVRALIVNGTYVNAVPQRRHLLVLGDSIAQGFVTDDPAAAWPSLLADRLGLDLINQGLGGQVFQPGTFYGLAHEVDPELVVVAFGENYRYEHCSPRAVARDVRNYLMEVSRIWSEVPTLVLTPLYHDEERSPSHRLSCWQRVPSMIAANVAAHDEMVLADGTLLMDPSAELLADDDGHPNALGAMQIASRLHLLTLARRGSAEERRKRVINLFSAGPRRAFPLVEGARRGIGEFVVAEKRCVVWDVDGEQKWLFGSDHDMCEAAISLFLRTPLVGLCEPDLAEVAARRWGMSHVDPFHLAIYDKGVPLTPVEGKDIRVLDESYVDVIYEYYGRVEWFTREEIKAALVRGDILGGFEDDELVGFIGEHSEGDMGMLEVFEGHRRQGWGTALETAKVNQLLERGLTPWGEVFAGNRYSLKLQRKLGFKVTPAREQCFVSSPS